MLCKVIYSTSWKGQHPRNTIKSSESSLLSYRGLPPGPAATGALKLEPHHAAKHWCGGGSKRPTESETRVRCRGAHKESVCSSGD